jgi:hypothetical protein
MQVWHVTVKEPDAHENSAHRFVFTDPEAAWECYQRAQAAGFEARGVKVVRTRELVKV